MTTYYIRLFDANGHPITGPNGTTWFEVSLPSSSLTNSGGGVGIGAGTTAFSPLSFTFNDNSTIDSKLLGTLTSGSGIREIELASFTSASLSSPPHLTDDYVYTGVNVTGLGVDGGAGTDTLTFSYLSTEAEHVTSTGATSTSEWSAVTKSAQLNPPAVDHLSPGSSAPSQVRWPILPARPPASLIMSSSRPAADKR